MSVTRCGLRFITEHFNTLFHVPEPKAQPPSLSLVLRVMNLFTPLLISTHLGQVSDDVSVLVLYTVDYPHRWEGRFLVITGRG